MGKSFHRTLYFLQDHLGSTTALTNSSGSVIESASYDSFGNSTNNLTTRYQFTGREYDSDIGLQYSRARWYDAKLGRFISEDPIGFGGGDVNLYGYVRSNPQNLVDPRGLDIVIIENGATGGNPGGHTAIAISGMGVISFGNGNPDIPGENMIGGSFGSYLAREVPRRTTTLYQLPTSPEQDKSMFEKALEMDYFRPPLDFTHIAVDNCSLRINEILDAGDIPNNNWYPYRLPGSAGNRAANLGSSPAFVPQGAFPRIVTLGPDNNWRRFEPRRYTANDFIVNH